MSTIMASSGPRSKARSTRIASCRRDLSSTFTLLALTLIPLASCTTASPEPLAERIDRIIAKAPQATVSIAYYDLETGASLFRREHELLHAASTMKVPVMLALFREVETGALRLDQPVRVHNEFRSIFDGSSYALDPKEDSDPELYQLIGTEQPLSELIRRMIVRSSNLATNIVIDFAGATRINELMSELGAGRMRVLRGVEDQKAYDAGMNNMTTAWDLMLVMRAIAEQRAISPRASAQMLEILEGQEDNDKIPSGLPRGTIVANKTGDITAIHHDAAIVYPPGRRPFVLVVLTRGFERSKDADQVIGSIARTVWERR